MPACRECILPRLDLNSRVFTALPGGTVIGQFSKCTSHFFIENMDSKSRFHLRMIQTEHSGLRYAEGRINSHISNPEHNLTGLEVREERQEIETCSAEQEPSSIGRTRAEQFKTLPDPICFVNEIISMK